MKFKWNFVKWIEKSTTRQRTLVVIKLSNCRICPCPIFKLPPTATFSVSYFYATIRGAVGPNNQWQFRYFSKPSALFHTTSKIIFFQNIKNKKWNGDPILVSFTSQPQSTQSFDRWGKSSIFSLFICTF